VWNARFSGLSEGHWHRFRAVQGCQTLENEVDRFLSDRLLGAQKGWGQAASR